MVRQERVEDPNVWKPKHASKTKDKEGENPDKAGPEVNLTIIEVAHAVEA